MVRGHISPTLASCRPGSRRRSLFVLPACLHLHRSDLIHVANEVLMTPRSCSQRVRIRRRLECA